MINARKTAKWPGERVRDGSHLLFLSGGRPPLANWPGEPVRDGNNVVAYVRHVFPPKAKWPGKPVRDGNMRISEVPVSLNRVGMTDAARSGWKQFYYCTDPEPFQGRNDQCRPFGMETASWRTTCSSRGRWLNGLGSPFGMETVNKAAATANRRGETAWAGRLRDGYAGVRT